MTAATLPGPYTPAEVLRESRRQVQDLVCGMPGTDPSQMGFEFPWEIRAFAMAVAAHKALGFDWTEFQAALIASIQKWEDATGSTAEQPWSYYEHWVAALETVMAVHGSLPEADLDAKTQRILAEPPNRNHHEAHTEPIAIDPAS
ncbi:nitrile hydratase accessory protein [Nocardioides panzhihuensis]|uniref:Nitrile hydratase accessory protein n=1 Tax=Nocardioides panzhihuensis TaxID=860243 RepID=A0A7Z0DJF0_9ACTN|nr:nitrile hydratase accessory protein [Nocardioides panzhihuensis]NYI76720.1 nitrile hydratase accessory protein [Nocardioides panzhihuensis]